MVLKYFLNNYQRYWLETWNTYSQSNVQYNAIRLNNSGVIFLELLPLFGLRKMVLRHFLNNYQIYQLQTWKTLSLLNVQYSVTRATTLGLIFLARLFEDKSRAIVIARLSVRPSVRRRRPSVRPAKTLTLAITFLSLGRFQSYLHTMILGTRPSHTCVLIWPWPSNDLDLGGQNLRKMTKAS